MLERDHCHYRKMKHHWMNSII